MTREILRIASFTLLCAIAAIGCGPRSREPAPRLRGPACVRECEADRDSCYEICTDDDESYRCEEKCGEQLALCKQLCD